MKSIKLISKYSEEYPKKILKLKNPPDILFAIGNLELLNTFSIAIVGSRNFTLDKKVIAEKLVHDLSKKDITIISGMARGIDTIVHESCIEAGGKTIAILGSGFFVAKQQKIYNKILENNGLILSEYLPDEPAYKYNFPRRNELLAGISDGVIVIQAHMNSGTMITAKEALTQNKPLFTFPTNIDDATSLGNNYLLTQGAKCILNYNDVLKNYENIEFKENYNSKHIKIPKEFSEIYSLLKYTPTHLSHLAQKLNIALPELQVKLTLMEIEGLITKLPNSYFIKNNTSENF